MMGEPVSSFLSLVAPAAVGVFLLGLQLYIRHQVIDPIKLNLPVFGPFSFEIPLVIKNLSTLRLLLFILALGCFAIPAFRDYSSFFPRRLHMEAFFDDEGLKHALTQFTSQELESFGIKVNWQTEKQRYLAELNDKIYRQIGVKFRFEGARGSVHSQGEALLEFRKVKGFQKYHIDKAEGSLVHVMEIPRQKRLVLTSEFQLLETEANRIQVSLPEIYFKYTKIIRPEFKQIIRLSPVQEVYDHQLVAITKIRFFPMIDIGQTVYLARDKLEGQLIPVGYAIYTPE